MGVLFSRRFCFVNLFALYFLYFSNLRRSEIKRCKGRLFLPVSKYSDKVIIAETEKETVRKCHSRAGRLAWLARMGATCRAFLALFLFTCVLLASFYFILFFFFSLFHMPTASWRDLARHFALHARAGSKLDIKNASNTLNRIL